LWDDDGKLWDDDGKLWDEVVDDDEMKIRSWDGKREKWDEYENENITSHTTIAS